MAKRRTFQVVLTGIVPKGMTIAQARHAVWNQGLDLDIDVSQYLDWPRGQRPMKMKVGRASMTSRGDHK